MSSENGCRLAMVPAGHIKRMPGIKNGTSKRLVQKTKAFVKQRGFYMPVVLSEAGGCMTLLSGAATFEVCLDERIPKIPAVVFQTDGDADELMFSLQSAELNAPHDAMYTSSAVIRLIDAYSVPRREIAELLGKSPAWVSRMEGLRRLSAAVWDLVSDGLISARAAQEIARLPADVQAPFAVSAGNEFLNKEDVTCLVNRYLDADTSVEERDRIVRSPKRALPETRRGRRMWVIDQLIGARLARAMASCFDSVSFLSNILEHNDMDHAAINESDAAALVTALSALVNQLRYALCPGGKGAGGND